MKKTKLMLGDNIKSLQKLPDNSIDSIVTDPPYGLSFMGKKWDYDVPTVEFWKEVWRVLKPGGHVLSFGGTRTYHRMTVNIEDAGFEIRDQIMWLYGSGFPKSHNIGKAVDKFGGNNLLSSEIGTQLKEARTKRGLTLKAADELFCGGTSNYNWLEGRSDGQRIPNGELFDKIIAEWPELKDIRDKVLETEREILGTEITNKTVMSKIGEENEAGEYVRTKGQSPYEGWGTALKPANEPICVARKPLSEKSVAENVLKWGTGGINIDGCRVGSEVRTTPVGSDDNRDDETLFGLNKTTHHERVETTEGRFPANIILDEIAGELLDEQSGITKTNHKGNRTDKGVVAGVNGFGRGTEVARCDSGGASRFFFKASYNFLEQKEYKMKSECQQNNYKLVQYVEQNGLNISQITELIAQTNVEEKVKNKLALLVKSALNLSEKCTMYIVANIVAIATENMASPLTQDFITELENYILIQNLAQIVEMMDNTDTTPTTQDLMKLFGSALRVIEKHTQLDQEQEKEEKKSEQSTSTYRFRYQAKVSKAERNMGLDEFEDKIIEGRDAGQDERAVAFKKRPTPTKNVHPTVKPVALMSYLCRLVTPAGGIVLDPFMGSGSTGIAAQLEGFRFCGMEMDGDYFKIAEARIENYEQYKKFIK